jgi:hypothetical protein
MKKLPRTRFGWSWLTSVVLLLTLLLQGAAPVAAALQGAQPPTPAPDVPRGLRFLVTLDAKLQSGKGKAGDTVRYMVAQDVLSPDGKTVLIARGTPAIGTLVETRGAGMYGRPGKLAFTCDALPSGQYSQVGLRLVGAGDKTGDRTAERIITGTGLVFLALAALSGIGAASSDGWEQLGNVLALGASLVIVALVFGIIGPLVRGKNVSVAAGTTFTVEVVSSPAAPLSDRVG